MRRTPAFRNRLTLGLRAGLLALALATVSDARAQTAGASIFVKPPTTPLELWDAADFLVRTGQPDQAVPFLKKFLESQADDATLVQVRDRYGVKSVLQLDDHPETRALARPLAALLNAAARRQATDPERVARFLAMLSQSREEQDYGVEQLRHAGPYAVPFLIQTLQRPGLPLEDRALIVWNGGRLGDRAVPPLLAALDSPDGKLVRNVIEMLTRIGDVRAVPQLTYLAASSETIEPNRAAARQAIERLTGRSFSSQPLSPVRTLTAEARRYHRHAVPFVDQPVLIWEWNGADQTVTQRTGPTTEAEASFGLKYAREALLLDPSDRPAQVVLTSLALEKAVEGAGHAAFTTTDPAFAAAMAAGPAVLGAVVRSALADDKTDLAAAAVTALGQVTDANALATDRRPNPLVDALSSPSRRVQFAAAKALIGLDPPRPFAGSSRVVPVLSRFASSQSAPRAVVIDGNLARGGQLVGFLKALGYDPILEPTGDAGFRAASDSADVELIFVDHHMIAGDWRLTDTLGNLKADARTSGVPLYVVGRLNVAVDRSSLLDRFPGVRFLVQPTSAALLERQLGGRPQTLTAAERSSYAQGAAGLLARVASQPNSVFAPGLARAETALTIALHTPPTSANASVALSDVPMADAQSGLADVVLDPSHPVALRVLAAGQLARSVRHYGPLVAGDQETKLLSALDRESDPTLKAALAAVVGALRPQAALAGARLRQYARPPATSPAQAPAAPEAVPSPPPPDTAKPDADAPAPKAPEAQP